ncbi:uncharacterized protein ARMOST_19443 [Armillaria ostoyae]|uniref:Uncharacterized protein n=1 Tax=Armillaria ostoyae TaxID=47428 RepID=A0A284S4J4_ARMOS|nr:uncharacterized protein ARMOST_19443 [Armillaria ostoyae]
MAYIYSQPSTNFSVPTPPENPVIEEANDLLMATYGPERPDPQNIIQLISHGTRDRPCIPDSVAKKFTIHQPFYICLDTPPNTSTCHSPKAYGRLKYTFPIPMSDRMLYKIEFGWASMLQVLQGDRSCTPDSTYPVALVGVECIDVVFHVELFSSTSLAGTNESQASGYLPQYIRIPLICKHRRGMSFYELAYSVSAGYREIFRREAEKVSPGRTAPMTHVVMNVNNLRLGSLYTDDPSKTRWWAEVVLIDAL